MTLNQTSVCDIINTLEQCKTGNSVDAGFSNFSQYYPLLGLIGPAVYIFLHNRPKVEKKELSHYINAEANIRFHEYEFNISLGSKKLDWIYSPRLGFLKSITVLSTTKLELYFRDEKGMELHLAEEFIRRKTSKTRNEIFFKQITKLRDDNIETIYLITRDEERSGYQNRINTYFFPKEESPTKIKVSNGNNVPIINYKIILSKNQTKNVIKKKKNFDKFVEWNNKDVADCLIEKSQLIIIVKEIPKKSSGVNGEIIIDLV